VRLARGPRQHLASVPAALFAGIEPEGEPLAAKAELKKLVPEDAREAIGHGIRARRSKSGAISFDLLEPREADYAPL
jgi:hypothetical protein